MLLVHRTSWTSDRRVLLLLRTTPVQSLQSILAKHDLNRMFDGAWRKANCNRLFGILGSSHRTGHQTRVTPYRAAVGPRSTFGGWIWSQRPTLTSEAQVCFFLLVFFPYLSFLFRFLFSVDFSSFHFMLYIR